MPEHLHRNRQARQFLVLAFLLLRIADALVIWYTLQPGISLTVVRGLVIGSTLWTTALLVGVWRRQRWARYVLTGLNWCFMVIFSYPVLQALSHVEPAASSPYFAPGIAVLLYLAANTVLIHSRRVRHYANA